MAKPIQKLLLADRRWQALLDGDKLDTIRYNEQHITEGFLLYEGTPTTTNHAVVKVTATMNIPLREVLNYTHDTQRKNSEEKLLELMRHHYLDIQLDTTIQYIQHLSVAKTRERYPQEVDEILARL